MSTAKFKHFQIGDDADPAKNFTIRVPSTPDGTLQIVRGNWDDVNAPVVATLDENGLVDPRVMVNYFGIRSQATDYENDTGMPIRLTLSGSASAAGQFIRVQSRTPVLHSLAVQWSHAASVLAFTIEIMPGEIYVVDATATIAVWREYRNGGL